MSTKDNDLTDKPAESTSISSVTEHEKEIAQNGLQEFEKGNFESALQALNKLLNIRTNDPKALHNKAVTEFYLSSLTKIEEFRKSVSQICNQSHTNVEESEGMDDVDHCVIYYNQAVVLYHLRQYHSAISVLDKVFQFIEPIEENLAKKVCFLLLELYLSTSQPDKAVGMVGYIENMLFGNQVGNNGSKSQSPEKEKGEKEANKDNLENSANEKYRPKVQQYKARLYIMLKSMKACKREIKSLMNSSGASLSAIYLKSNLEYLRGNYRKALKVLNTAPQQHQSFLETGEILPAMYYNNVGCIHFYMGKPHLGCFYFQKALQENENAMRSIPKQDSESVSEKPLLTYGANHHYELLYNLGIQLLHAGRPLQAFDCLMETIQVYSSNPRLWLRLAECCIYAHKTDNEFDFKISQRKKEMVQGVVGAAAHRKIILSSGISVDNKYSSETQSAAMPNPTLEFASLCLKNALLLLPEDNTQTTSLPGQGGTGEETEGVTPPVDSNICIPAPPGNPIRGSEIINLRSSILAASAFVALCLRDNLMALKYSEALLNQPKLSGAHRFLGHLYAGEALILLDQISNAVQHLNPDKIKDISLTVPSNEKEDKEKSNNNEIQQESRHSQGWYPNTTSTAHIIMRYNLTVAYALRGELEKASDILRQVGTAKTQGTDIPIQAIMLAMYIHLQQGDAELSKNIIKQYNPQYR